MQPQWLSPGEEIIGSWPVYLGGEGHSAAKVVGKLHVTNRNVYFDAGLALAENAAAELSNRVQAYEKLDQQLCIPLKDIRQAEITRKFLILKSLHLVLACGRQYDIHFGAASPQKALDAILSGRAIQ
ncbi:MAG: hypothetical protein LLG01_17970 [Planctomycetaceae bacterium]|nr:hypothetical protein [Planctomycetaceae bacterium]